MRHRVCVGRNEQTSRVLTNAKRRLLNFVIVEMSVKANDNRANIFVVFHVQTFAQSHFFTLISFTTRQLDAKQVKFFPNTSFTDNVDFTVELDRLEVRGSRKGGGKNVLRRDVQPQTSKLLQISRSGLGGVVGDEKQLLAHTLEHFNSLRNAINQRVTFPNDTIAIENKCFGLIEQLFCFRDVHFALFMRHRCRDLCSGRYSLRLSISFRGGSDFTLNEHGTRSD